MAVERAERFDLKDLYLDVRLEALVDGEPFDFTGRRHFSIGFMKDGIGFGITDIKIDVNTSLQPIIEVTFIDLHGNTMFGGQYNDKNVDYSSFFRWPPPKFLFTFKGYLGKPVTWMLNLKQYDINFLAQSGHYELKASFVPNQWGFFADIPFLYLLAAKRLRMNKGASQEEAASIFDLIKIGKQVEVKTAEATKKFDIILKKMSSMQSDIAAALSDSKIVAFGERVVGQVGNQSVKGFQEIFVTDVTTVPNSGLKSLEDVKLFSKSPSDRILLNQFLMSKVNVDGKKGAYDDYSLERFRTLPNDVRETEKRRVTEVLKNNIFNINEEIKASVYDASKFELSQVTISEIFRQIAKDTAYVMGRILEAGFKGNSNDERTNPSNSAKGSPGMVDRYDRRNSQENETRPKIVGQYYPLTENDGNEVPALSENTGGLDYGVTDAGCEMDFVREFINAIIEGIAQDLTGEDEAATAISDDRLVARINNLEALSRNPYRPYYASIVENVLIRSGIVAFMTRSNDPNLPGDYDSFSNIDRDSFEEISALAQEDAKNITENMLKGMSEQDKMLLETFVDFFDKLLVENGEDLLNAEGKAANALNEQVLNNINTPVHPSIMGYQVVMNVPSGSRPSDFNTQQKIYDALASGVLKSTDCKSFSGFVMSEIIGRSALKDFVDPTTLVARKLVNNGLIYTYPHNDGNEFFVLVYEGDDARAIKEVNNTATDSEFNSTDIDKDEDQAKGLIEISTFFDGDGEDALGRVDELNSYIDDGLALDYSSLKSIPVDYYKKDRFGDTLGDDIDFDDDEQDNGIPPEMNALLWKRKIIPNSEAITDPKRQVKAGDIVYTVVYHKDTSDGIVPVTRAVFGPFLKGNKGRNQRIYIKAMCVEIKSKLKKLQLDKQEVISRVLGNANEAENIIYKQMHSLFYQWNTVAYKDNISETGDVNGSSLPANGDGVANDLEAAYGGLEKHVDLKTRSSEDVQNLPDPCFIYDYPLQRIREMDGPGLSTIDVRHAIINLDPLYKPDANTTVLNMLYNLCNKNNFLFIPIPGYAGYLNVKDVFKPYIGSSEVRIRNFFHVLFMPTPESRSMISNKTYSAPLTFHDSDSQRSIKGDAIAVEFGSVNNQIIKSVSVNTRDNKVTAESIINLQRLTDKEDNNKTVTTDCSMLNVMGGRSYTSSVDTLGNAQIYPMQFYFLEKMPLFDGLYQIMKVQHVITPNNMNTTFEGIRMRFNPGSGYFSVPPITLGTLQKLLEERPRDIQIPDNLIANADGTVFDPSKQAGEGEVKDGTSVESVRASGDEDTDEVVLLQYIKQAQQSSRLTNMGDLGPIVDNNGPNGLIADKAGIIQCMNHFIEDILEPFAKYFKERDPNLFKKWTITSAARKWKPGSRTTSQHLRGQAVDSSIVFTNQADGLLNNHKLFNYIMDFYAANPSKEYGQLLLETKNTAGRPQIWVHWSYKRIGDNYKQRLRFVNDVTLNGTPMNTGRGGPQNNLVVTLDDARMKNFLG